MHPLLLLRSYRQFLHNAGRCSPVHGYKGPLWHHCYPQHSNGFLAESFFLALACFLNNYFTFSTISTNLHLLVLLNGRVSMIFTRSPMLHSFFSSCAWNLVVFFTNFP